MWFSPLCSVSFSPPHLFLFLRSALKSSNFLFLFYGKAHFIPSSHASTFNIAFYLQYFAFLFPFFFMSSSPFPHAQFLTFNIFFLLCGIDYSIYFYSSLTSSATFALLRMCSHLSSFFMFTCFPFHFLKHTHFLSLLLFFLPCSLVCYFFFFFQFTPSLISLFLIYFHHLFVI